MHVAQVDDVLDKGAPPANRIFVTMSWLPMSTGKPPPSTVAVNHARQLQLFITTACQTQTLLTAGQLRFPPPCTAATCAKFLALCFFAVQLWLETRTRTPSVETWIVRSCHAKQSNASAKLQCKACRPPGSPGSLDCITENLPQVLPFSQNPSGKPPSSNVASIEQAPHWA